MREKMVKMKYKEPNIYVSYRNHGLGMECSHVYCVYELDVSSTILKSKYFVEL